MVRIAAPEMVGDTHLERYIATEMAKNEAKALRRCSRKLRTMANKEWRRGGWIAEHCAETLDKFANEFAKDARTLEKAQK